MYVLQDMYQAHDQCVENVSYCTCSTCFQSLCTLQSSEMTVAVSEAKEEIATFVDANDDTINTVESVPTAIENSAVQTVGELKNFLSRPVRIADYSWLEATAAGDIVNIEPWLLYLSSTQIKSKLNNFTWFRGNLH